MAIAKNIVSHGVWGVSKYEFSSSSSSPFWTVLISISYLIFGVNELSPLVINIFLAILTILFSYQFLKANITSPSTIFIVLLAAILVAPLPTLTISGMEHVLHILVTILVIKYSLSVISGNSSSSIDKEVWILSIIAPLLLFIRLEGCFLLFVVYLILFLKKKIKVVSILCVSTIIPYSIFGVVSIINGWEFFPNSILLKANIPDPTINEFVKLIGLGVLNKIQKNTIILFLLLFSLILLFIQFAAIEKLFDKMKNAVIIFIGSLLLHMQFASTGWLYRYEAYLVFLGFIILSIVVFHMINQNDIWQINKKSIPFLFTFVLILLTIGTIFTDRAIGSLKITQKATSNIYQQQYQIGKFLNEYYNGSTIILNDIGAASFLADINLVDLWGIASKDVAKIKRKRELNSITINTLAIEHQVKIAILYDEWYDIPTHWNKVGSWRILNNVITGSDIVSFYSIDSTQSAELIKNLTKFRTQLPTQVEQIGNYVFDDF